MQPLLTLPADSNPVPEAFTPFNRLMADLERRHLATLTFQELRRALQALSNLYVHRRDNLASSGVFDGAGKRAAFAAFYGPLHYLLVRHIAEELELQHKPFNKLVELGCGTGTSGAAWLLTSNPDALFHGFDLSSWAIGEASHCLRSLGIHHKLTVRDALKVDLKLGAGDAILAAFTINELPTERLRDQLLDRLIACHERGAQVLIIEPIARSQIPWWPEWSMRFIKAGGRADEWRAVVELPEFVKRLDKAARLDHRELTGRSLYLNPSPARE